MTTSALAQPKGHRLTGFGSDTANRCAVKIYQTGILCRHRGSRRTRACVTTRRDPVSAVTISPRRQGRVGQLGQARPGQLQCLQQAD